jgi:hypothetical protein
MYVPLSVYFTVVWAKHIEGRTHTKSNQKLFITVSFRANAQIPTGGNPEIKSPLTIRNHCDAASRVVPEDQAISSSWR